MDNWFSTQVDRDFQTGMYGYGIRLYNLDLHYYLITGVSYDEEKNILVVKNKGHNIILSTEPNTDYFKNTLLTYWRNWDNSVGKHYEEDRCDYKPWAHTSLAALAAELGLHSSGSVNVMYIR
tara:strand:- start:801 stop:1166 length:366 start_codon:yes stop_codon:yes gene_type:complete